MKKAINKMMQKVQGKQPELNAKNFWDLKKLAFSTLCLKTRAVVWDNTSIIKKILLLRTMYNK